MKNKKLLNIFVLLLTLVTFVIDILLFAFPAYNADTSTFLKVIFWIFNSLALVCMVLTILVTLISLFADDYSASKIVEALSLVTFILSFINLFSFGLTKFSLSFGYIAVCLVTFVTASLGQLYRLISSTPTWVKTIKGLLKINTKPVTIIDATHPKNEENVEQKTEVDFNDIV